MLIEVSTASVDSTVRDAGFALMCKVAPGPDVPIPTRGWAGVVLSPSPFTNKPGRDACL